MLKLEISHFCKQNKKQTNKKQTNKQKQQGVLFELFLLLDENLHDIVPENTVLKRNNGM